MTLVAEEQIPPRRFRSSRAAPRGVYPEERQRRRARDDIDGLNRRGTPWITKENPSCFGAPGIGGSITCGSVFSPAFLGALCGPTSFSDRRSSFGLAEATAKTCCLFPPGSRR